MYEITTTITVNDATTTEVCVIPLETQEEVLDFYVDYLSMELARLYDELKAFNGRTFAAVEPTPDRRCLHRVINGASREFGRPTIDGRIDVTARHVA